jgi:DNA primase
LIKLPLKLGKRKGRLSGYFGDSAIEEIKSKTDIVGLISEYVTLKKAGRLFQGFCPFHEDTKTPSFKVTEERQTFHCFGCQVGGDVFSFIQRKENLTFPEAVRWLAERAGVELVEKEMSPARKRARSEAESIARINELAVDYYVEQLERSGEARGYLGDRGLKQGTIEKFRLGYAPDTWEGLVTYLSRKKADKKHAELAGLVRSRESGGYYDLFRGRITFPLHDLQGRVIGFGGRTLGEVTDKNPKYYNTPETALFKKSRNLYGLHQARKAIEKSSEVIVVEGNVSLLTPFEAGFENIVAPLGTAFTNDQFRLLTRRGIKKMYVAFDGDDAGRRAALKTAEMALEHEVPAVFVDFEEKFDPDDTIRKYGPERFRELLESARDLFDFIIEEVEKKSSGEKFGHGSFIASIVPFIEKSASSVVREQFIMKVSSRTGYVGPDSIRSMIDGSGPPVDWEHGGYPEEEEDRVKKVLSEEVMAIVFWTMPEYRPMISELVPVVAEGSRQNLALNLLNSMVDCVADTGTLDYRRLLGYIKDESENQLLSRLLLTEFGVDPDDVQNLVDDCFSGPRGMTASNIKLEMRKLRMEIAEAERSKDSEKVLSLMKRMQHVKEELGRIQIGH